MKRPYHDDLEAMRSRLAVLEQAEQSRSCASCAERLLLAKRPPTFHRVLATILGLVALAVLFSGYAACSSVPPVTTPFG